MGEADSLLRPAAYAVLNVSLCCLRINEVFASMMESSGKMRSWSKTLFKVLLH